MEAEFVSRFEHLKKFKSTFAFFLNPFNYDNTSGLEISDIMLVEKAAGELELLEMKEDLVMEMQHKSSSTIDFWKLVPETKYPNLKIAACRLISIFSTTYCYKSLYSTMKLVKSKYHSKLTNKNPVELLRTGSTNYEPNFKQLAKQLQ